MQDESSTFGLKREKLAKLWALGEDASGRPPAAERVSKAELLRHQLAESLPLEIGMAHMLPGILSVVCEKLRPFAGCSFGALLTDPQTDLAIVEAIKELHKQQAEAMPPGPGQDVATIIYYAAIASALVHHNARITKLSQESLTRSFDELAGSNWLPADIRKLFDAAHTHCVARVKGSEECHD